MNVIAMIQARMGSTRLPGKVLMNLAGEPMLARIVERVGRAESLDSIVIATTDGPSDDRLATFCDARGWNYFRGSTDDVLDRYYRAAIEYQADAIVRITADEPIIDPVLIDRVVERFLAHRGPIDYVSNFLPPRTFPRGQEVEVFSWDALERSWREDDNPAWREHVDMYIHRHPERFVVEAIHHPRDWSSLRWTVDVPADLELIRMVYHHFGHDRFGWREVLHACENHSEWRAINGHVHQKKAG